ncbi:MAG: heparinase II/III family protein [Clostridia bacterium]
MNIYELDPKLLETHKETIDGIRQKTMDFVKDFQDDPSKMSDWGHKYFCPEDGSRLIFDLKKPHAHECPSCGKTFQSEIFDNTWTNLYRGVVFDIVVNLAILYKLEDKEVYMTEYKRILSFYADNYDKFVYHSKHVVCPNPPIVNGVLLDAGKIMPQALGESDVMSRIIISLEILKDDIEKEFVDYLLEKMFRPAIEYVLKPQITQVHNKPCLDNCTIAMIGLYTNTPEFVDYAIDGEWGLNTQLKQGVTDAKFWYEGSIHYHYFLLNGLSKILAFSKIYNKDFEGAQIIHDMLTAGYYYAFDNNYFPNPNDGWPDRMLMTYENTYALAAKALGEGSEVYNIYKSFLADHIGKKDSDGPVYHLDNPSTNHILCFPYLDVSNPTPIERKSTCFESSGFVTLKNKNVNVFLKYGHLTPSHAHADKMNVEVTFKNKFLTKDLSNPGYAAELYDVWYRRSVAHNTVIVDGVDHESIIMGKVLAFNENLCRTEVKEAYAGIDYKRDVALLENGYTDLFEVVSKDSHNYDYIYHCEGELLTKLDTSNADLGYKANGYECISDVLKVNCSDNTITLKWLVEDLNVESTIDIKGKELYIVKTYDNPASNLRTSILLREKTDTTKFSIEWKMV